MDRKQKAAATRQKKKAAQDQQVIVINDKWKIVRLDELNWAVVFSGKHPITGERQDAKQPWVYGKLIDALLALPHKMLDEGQKKTLADILKDVQEMCATLERLRFMKFSALDDNLKHGNE